MPLLVETIQAMFRRLHVIVALVEFPPFYLCNVADVLLPVLLSPFVGDVMRMLSTLPHVGLH